MKIGNYSLKKDSKLTVTSILGKVAIGLVAYFVITSLPDLKRYVHISMM